MSAAPWKTATEKPYGFRVTIERDRKGFRELHTFPSKTPRLNTAVQAATYKQGFVRLVKAVPLTREEWDRAYPASRIAPPASRR